MSTQTKAAAAGVAFLMLGASACGQADSSTPTSTSTDSAATEYVSPIATFLGVDFDGGDQQDEYLADERTRMDWVATCMAAEGFEYRGIDPAVWADMGSVDPDQPEWGTPEWVAIYGFGVSTQMFDQETVGPELVGNSYNSGNVAIDDPNEAYLSTLSDEEQTAYWNALYGNNGYEWDDSMSEEENQVAAETYFENVVETGCEPRSYETRVSNDPYSQLYETFGEELSAMYERVESDPEMITALADISRCSSQAGFNFTDEQSMNEDIQQRLEPVQNMVEWPGSDLDEDGWAALSDEARADLDNQQPIMTAEGKAILAEVQQYEIEMATAVFGCGFGDMMNLYPKLLMRYEQEFVDSHRSDLESFRTS